MRGRWRWLVLLIATLALYPLAFLLRIALDTLSGERLFAHQLAYEQRLLLDSFVADFAASLPLVLVLGAAIALLARVAPRTWPAGAVAALVGLAVWMGGPLGAGTPITPATIASAPAPHFLLVGGGPKPSASEAQIEFNVNWVRASLRELLPGAPITTWFANGDGDAPTAVRQVSRQEEPDPPLGALASVYGEASANRLRYRRHQVVEVAGSTHADTLVPALRRYLEGLEPGAQAMLIYNGHGSWESDRAENTLRLWDESSLSVREFARLLAAADSAVPVRFVLTQCYSGAFARAVHEDADHERELARGARCGFLAESSERESEGCSASLGLGDYRDYTTYFVAALTGRDRYGAAVDVAADRDGDGRLSPFDAHLQAVAIGYNGDLPRSTSEEWLEQRQPWRTRWAGTGRLPENLYGRLAREIARNAGLPEDGAALGDALTASYDSLVAANDATLGERERIKREASRVRERMQERLERRWPQLAQPYTASFRETMARESGAIETAIRSDTAFSGLQRREEQLDSLEMALVDLDRRIGRLDRLRRTRMLARALDHLERTGGEDARATYARVRACEAIPLR